MRRWRAARAARIGLGVLAALGAAHAEGVPPRDVKPANILVGPDGRVVLTTRQGYHRFTNSTGFSIGVPDGWQIQHVGHYVYIIDPSNAGIFLLIDQSDTPKPNPLLD